MKKNQFSKGLISLLLLFPLGCKSIQDQIYESPLTIITESTTQVLSDPKVNELYKEYFPYNRFELSYRIKTKDTTTRLFFEPKISLNEESIWINAGIEFKY